MQAGTATAFAQVREQRESMPCNRVTLNLIHPDPILTAYSHSLPTGLNADASLSQAIRYVLSHPGSLHRAHLASRIAVDYGADHNTATFLATAGASPRFPNWAKLKTMATASQRPYCS